MRMDKLFFLVQNIACAAGARKGKGEGKSGTRDARKIERKIAISAFLIMRQSLPDTTPLIGRHVLEAV